MPATVKKTLIPLLLSVLHITAFAQLKPVYVFWQDDSLLKKNYYAQALAKQNTLISKLGKEYQDDYKEIYRNRFDEVAKLLKSNRTVTAPVAHEYLQKVLKQITDANAELKPLQVRLIFSRDWWPNAYSMGEGTLVVNAGLMIFLQNEAELVFVLCHELAHFYLDHSDKAIKKNVELVNSETFKKEVKRISKEEYRAGQQLENLLKPLMFGSRQHSRQNEVEADRQAFMFMKKTGYDCSAIRTTLELLDKVDDSLLYQPVSPEQVFSFNEYPFRKKWIQKESAIFSQMDKDDSPLSKKERDSLKTHPDCTKRIALLTDSIQALPSTGVFFFVDEKLFARLKMDCMMEITEQNYRDENLSRNLYYSILLLQKEENTPLAVYSIARCLNQLYKKQKNHTLGLAVETENRKLPADYNLLLRMISRLKLDEIASLNYFFCRHYRDEMTGYAGFEEEMNTAQRFKNESQF